LADRYAHAVRAEVTEAEYAFAVGDHDHPRRIRPVAQHFGDMTAVLDTHENTAWPLKDLAIFLAGETHRRRVDDRHHFVDMVDHHAEEKCFVAIVKRVQRDV